MRLAILAVGDITTDPRTSEAPSEHERIKGAIGMAVGSPSGRTAP